MKSKIKILHFITNSCDHPYLYSVTEYADKSKYEISVGSLNSAGDLQKYYKAQGIEAFSLETNHRSQFPRAVIKLARFLRKNKIDIIQTHLYDASIVGMAAAMLARVKLRIFTGHHSQEIVSHKEHFQRNLHFWLDRFVIRWLSQYIIAPSEQMKQSFIDNYSVAAEKIAVVHHGFNFEIWQPSEDAREGIRKEFALKNKIVFGAMGRISWIKDYSTLIKAFAVISTEFPEAVLMIVGAGDQTNLRHLVNSLSIEQKVVFTGWRNDAPALFSAIDVFIHSSLAESFGMVIVEAMAMEKPVICTDVGIAREIIEEGVNGFLVPLGNEEKFVSAMRKTIEMRSRWQEIGTTNCLQVQEFTAAKMTAGYEECYIKWFAEKTGKSGAAARIG